MHHKQHAQTHQLVRRIGVAVLFINRIVGVALGTFQMLPHSVNVIPLRLDELDSGLCALNALGIMHLFVEMHLLPCLVLVAFGGSHGVTYKTLSGTAVLVQTLRILRQLEHPLAGCINLRGMPTTSMRPCGLCFQTPLQNAAPCSQQQLQLGLIGVRLARKVERLCLN